MKKLNVLFSLLIIFTLVLSACGGANEAGDATGTDTTGIEETGLPDTGDTGTTATETTGITGTETETVETTETVEATASVAATETVEPTETVEETETTGTDGSVLPPTGMADPSRLTTLLTFDVRNANGDQLADVDNMVIDLGSQRILHVILASGGFLGIGEKLIPVPWENIQMNPACLDAAMGTGTAGSTDSSDTGSTEAGTEAQDVDATGTPGTGTDSGSDTTNEVGMDSCYFLLNADDEILRNAPNFDLDALPDIDTADWDAEFNDYWINAGSGTGASSDTTGSADTTATPGTGASGSAAATSTPGSTEASGGSTTTQAGNRLILADELIGMNVVSGGTGSAGSSGETGTGSESSTEATATPGSGSSGTDTEGTDATGTDETMAGEPFGAVTDAIVDLQTGMIRYLIVTGESAAEAELSGRLIPVPVQALLYGMDANETPMLTLDLDPGVLIDAPSFDEGTLPNTSVTGWDIDLNTYWSGQGFDLDINTTSP